jgi:hypothetical protein
MLVAAATTVAMMFASADGMNAITKATESATIPVGL